MTNLKEKLSANVRRAKAAQQPEAEKPAEKDVVAKPVAAKPAAAKPAASKPPAVKPAPAKRTVAKPTPKSAPAGKSEKGTPSANVVKESGTALFPSRVWPD